jgi:hypothetical protein
MPAKDDSEEGESGGMAAGDVCGGRDSDNYNDYIYSITSLITMPVLHCVNFKFKKDFNADGVMNALRSLAEIHGVLRVIVLCN